MLYSITYDPDHALCPSSCFCSFSRFYRSFSADVWEIMSSERGTRDQRGRQQTVDYRSKLAKWKGNEATYASKRHITFTTGKTNLNQVYLRGPAWLWGSPLTRIAGPTCLTMVLHRCYIGVTMVLQRCWDGVAMALQWCHNGVTMVHQWRYKGVTMVFQWCYDGVAMVLTWSHNGAEKYPKSVTIVLQWCYPLSPPRHT
jgi:hypothetical protein